MTIQDQTTQAIDVSDGHEPAGDAPEEVLWSAFSAGTAIDVGGNAPLLIDEPNAVWMVETGSIHVFLVPIEAGRVVGVRTFLFGVQPRDLIFSTERRQDSGMASTGLLITGVPGSRVRCLPQPVLDHLLADPATAEEVAARLHTWIDRVGASVRPSLPPQQYERLEPEADLSLAPETHGRPLHELVWVRSPQHHAALWGQASIGLPSDGSWFPLSGESWITATELLELATTSTDRILADGGPWPGLRAFHSAALASALLVAEARIQSEAERLERKAASDEQALDEALAELAREFDDQLESPVVVRDPGDALLVAAQIVGEAAGIEIRRPPKSAAQRQGDEMLAIASASRVRSRTVALRGSWWQGEGVPTLAYLADGDAPVALIPEARTGFLLIDPRTGGRTVVTPAVANTLAPFGHVFYRPLPEEPLGVRELLRFGLRHCQKDLWVVLVMGLLGGALSLLTPIVTGALFDRIIPSAQRSQVFLVALALIVSAVSAALFQLTLGLGLLRLETKMGAATQAAVWDRLLNLPVPFFRRFTAGDLQMRAMGIDAIRQILGGIVVTSMLGGLFSLFSLGLLFHYSVKLAWMATAMVAVIIGITFTLNCLMLRYQRQIMAYQGILNGMVVQFITGISKLRVAAAENRAFLVWARAFSRQTEVTSKVRINNVHLSAVQSVTPVLTTMAIFAIVAYGMPTLSTGNFLAFTSAFGQFLTAMLAMSAAFVSLLQVVPIFERARPILEAEPEVGSARADPGVLSGDIQINGLSFRYHENGPLILDDVSLQIEPGEFVALVGPSGSGKSTMLRLLMGFESPSSGTIYYDQQDLADLDVRSIRRQAGVVLQHSQLMPGDIQANILGNSGYSVDDAWEAARMAGFDDDIRQLPMGMFTVVSEGMSTLSGGQRQRLMIARALVSKPRIVFFDEATSALDNHTQAAVSRSLEALQATRVVIAHRLSTIQGADRIYVLRGGRIVQSGGYDELMSVDGPFLDLARRQLA